MTQKQPIEPADADASVRIEQVRLLYSNLPVTQFVTLLVASALVAVQWTEVTPKRAVSWMLCLSASALLRIFLGIRFRRLSLSDRDAERWRTYFYVTAGISGLVWGSTAFVLYPADSVVHEVFLAFALAGMVAGGMTALTPALPAFVMFATFSILPIIPRFLLSGDFIHAAMGWTSAIYLGTLLVIGKRIHDTITRSLYLRFENNQLIENLTQTNVALERRVRERTQALEDADRRKNEFMTMLAHELRNPLAPMSAAVSLLGQVSTPAARNDAVAIMRRQLQQMVRLVDDLLDINRIQKGAISLRADVVEVSRFLNSSIETARPAINASNQKITVMLPSEPLFVKGDEARLAQVVSNILNNASKFTPHGGAIQIIAERQSTKVAISVKDSGIGIPGTHLDTIFEPFVQVDNSLERMTGGLGIGLSLVRQIVHLHGGNVQALSKGLGHGSEFKLMLPLAVGARDELASVSPHAPRREPSRKRNILIVDNNIDAANALAILLRTKGHEVREAYDGAHALAIASEFSPDIVVCDIAMPGMSGLEVAARLRLMYPANMTMIALTGYGSEEDKARTRQAGFDEHFVKPANLDELQSVIDRAGGFNRTVTLQ